MGYIKGIFERATIQGIADYLLFGSSPEIDERSYEERLDEPYKRFEKAVEKYDKNPASELLDLSNEITSETASVYTEIGLQLGILLMRDIAQNIDRENNLIRTDNNQGHFQFSEKDLHESNREHLLYGKQLVESEIQKLINDIKTFEMNQDIKDMILMRLHIVQCCLYGNQD
ncbi:hypothetical protein K280104A7_32920 [Candidatus Bariatricus faecipullorum]